MIEETKLITVESVKRWRDELVEDSKKELLEDGRIWRRCYIFTTAANAPGGKPTDDGTAIVVLDLEADQAGLLKMLEVVKPNAREAFALLREAGPSMGVPPKEIVPRILAVLEQRFGLTPPAIIGQYMRRAIEKLDAYAYVHVADSWTVQDEKGDRSNHPKDLSDDPSAQEALLVAMETHQCVEVISVPYERESRGRGKVVRFLEPKKMTSSDPGAALEGRLFNILRPMPLN